jgi:hypothetical protein
MFQKSTKKQCYGKHAAAATGVCLCLAVLGNALLAGDEPQPEEGASPAERIRNMPARRKVFNGVLLGAYVFQMTGAFYIMRAIGKLGRR